jgi:hypothetical protein
MRNDRAILILVAFASTATACHRQQAQTNDQNMALDEGMPTTAGNADIETLPADESSTTPSNQLQNGFDDADVNDVGPVNSE